MIEVKMYLYDSTEIALMAQFEAILTQKRNTPPEIAPPQAQGNASESSIVSPAGAAAPLVNEGHSAHLLDGGTNETRIREALARATPAPPVEVDDVTVQRTITAYGQKHGVPATIARMQEFFGVSKASLVPAERRVEFVGVFGDAQ